MQNLSKRTTTKLLGAALCVLALPLSAPAQAPEWRESARTAVHLLDYIGVDYPEFVQDGTVLDDAEYREQLEFAAQVRVLLDRLPQNPMRAPLSADAKRLTQLIEEKAAGERVAQASGELRRGIIEAYGLTVAPKAPPDRALGKRLYARECAACHGPEGRGDGPAGKGLEPPPSDFHDRARMASRSVYGLYNTITLGVAGTGMAAYKPLGEGQRWALAFHVSRFALSESDLARAETAWQSGAHADVFPDLASVVARSTEEVSARFGTDAALAHRWLRAHPEAFAAERPAPLQFTIDTLHESAAAYAQGEASDAQQLAITAYLEGFELVEASLDNLDSGLRLDIERELTAYRNILRSGASTEAVRAQRDRVVGLLARAQARLAQEGLSPAATLTASFVILLREGLEAILVLAAIVTFLVRSGRRDALPWVHAGWAAALGLGVLTWFVATYAIGVSGANREVTEGVTALIAAAVLLYVGLWLHSKASTDAWQRYIRDRIGTALGRGTLWALAAVSFLAVYRELFEIVLFYQALWAQAGEAGAVSLLGGIAAAAALLAVLGWAIFRYGLRLPVSLFFTATSLLLAILAVIFVGQGIAALQEAGLLQIDPVAFVRVPALGIFPTRQTLAAQLLVVGLIGASFYWMRRRRRAT